MLVTMRRQDVVTLAAVCAQIGAQIRTFMNAGYETTASALAFTVANVAAAPAAETRLLREVDAFGRESVPTYEDLDEVGIAYCTSPRKISRPCSLYALNFFRPNQDHLPPEELAFCSKPLQQARHALLTDGRQSTPTGDHRTSVCQLRSCQRQPLRTSPGLVLPGAWSTQEDGAAVPVPHGVHR